MFRTGNLAHLPSPTVVFRPLDSDCGETLEVAFLVLDKLLGRDAVLSRVFAKVRRDFGVTIVDTEDTRPC